ncbi:MAG: hypothetical protein KAQ98_13550 [Bacteriovoracaceae bacterium]|nr:hypothetical protein [Bacteriovoracaceae bacterium]
MKNLFIVLAILVFTSGSYSANRYGAECVAGSSYLGKILSIRVMHDGVYQVEFSKDKKISFVNVNDANIKEIIRLAYNSNAKVCGYIEKDLPVLLGTDIYIKEYASTFKD